jgi:hypothetical protein
MNILLLTHNLDYAIEWIKSQDEFNIFILDEREVAKQNIHKFQFGFDDLNYSNAMVNTMSIMQKTYKSRRPLVIVMDMRHQTAIARIAHDHSILYYNNSMKTRLNYHPTFKVDYKVEEFDNKLLSQLLTLNKNLLL